jgi:hypothetical protein
LIRRNTKLLEKVKALKDNSELIADIFIFWSSLNGNHVLIFHDLFQFNSFLVSNFFYFLYSLGWRFALIFYQIGPSAKVIIVSSNFRAVQFLTASYRKKEKNLQLVFRRLKSSKQREKKNNTYCKRPFADHILDIFMSQDMFDFVLDNNEIQSNWLLRCGVTNTLCYCCICSLNVLSQ